MEEVKTKEWFAHTNYSLQMKNGTHGSFSQSLYNAWVCAACSNRKKLVEAFPEHFPDCYSYYF